MLKNYKLINNVLGWAMCIVASTVFIMTAEPTVSFWDCGEYIATAHKLQVGHPPGAPTFQLIGCLFSLFASDSTQVAFTINAMSALCSGFTIMFLFWSISMLGKKLATVKGSLTNSKVVAVFGSALVGSLAYTFTDTFWFSAVEGEVYAMSSLCTAVVFWAILKWDEVADSNYSYRWIILIAYIIGLSIGVHLLNLLTLPAMILVIYFRKYKSSAKGIIYALLFSFVLVAVILWGIVPYTVKISSVFERFFTNVLHTGFNIGTIFYFLLIAGLLTWGLWYSEKKKKRLLNTGLLSLVFILVGYSTFLILPVRSNADTPINENDPDDAVSLLAYLNREQYESYPLIYGEYFNTPVVNVKDGEPVYVKKYIVENANSTTRSFFSRFEAEQYIDANKNKGTFKIKERYEVGDDRQKIAYVYDGKYCSLFPRMWNKDPDRVRQYKHWAGITLPDYKDANGQVPNMPSFGQNVKFFFKYQLGYMYGRYFMWNFAGRQTLNQGFGNKQSGEWLSGINFIDEARLGPQDMPEHLKDKGRNTYYFLPLILGLLGLFFHFSRDSKNGLIVLMLFFMTGIAIGIYLNMYAYQPRERDYAFAASFYAFAVWIGLGVYAIYDWAKKYINKTTAAAVSTVACMGVPVILGTQNWDDHDRSKRYLLLNTAKAYLDSCAPDAILFANGDNDTFPLWYLQEVEGYRTDVRICNLQLMSADWYIDQAKRKAYDGKPVPVTMAKELYQAGTRDALQAVDRIKQPQNIKNVLQEIWKPSNNRRYALINTKNLYIDVDKEQVLKTGTVSENLSDQIVDRIEWTLPSTVFSKAYIAMMDILCHNNWERPIYYIANATPDTHFGLENYFQAEGLVYRLIPVKTPYPANSRSYGRIDTDILYDYVMNRYDFSQYADENIFLSDDYTRPVTGHKVIGCRLADKLLEENKIDSAINVLNQYDKWFPQATVPYDRVNPFLADIYIKCKTPEAIEKGLDYFDKCTDQFLKENEYYAKFKGDKAGIVARSIAENLDNLRNIYYLCGTALLTVDDQYKPRLEEIRKKINVQ
ncbi:MAG: DUF2723 domain-containing protein [Bacteroidales bacterium]|jgi:hypothetical protein|nr:DUF2723 domain-containing protein [Bacteroidales bacterium]